MVEYCVLVYWCVYGVFCLVVMYFIHVEPGAHLVYWLQCIVCWLWCVVYCWVKAVALVGSSGVRGWAVAAALKLHSRSSWKLEMEIWNWTQSRKPGALLLKAIDNQLSCEWFSWIGVFDIWLTCTFPHRFFLQIPLYLNPKSLKLDDKGCKYFAWIAFHLHYLLIGHQIYHHHIKMLDVSVSGGTWLTS